jgi:hypothetical protein
MAQVGKTSMAALVSLIVSRFATVRVTRGSGSTAAAVCRTPADRLHIGSTWLTAVRPCLAGTGTDVPRSRLWRRLRTVLIETQGLLGAAPKLLGSQDRASHARGQEQPATDNPKDP